jgi:hypothetical protein
MKIYVLWINNRQQVNKPLQNPQNTLYNNMSYVPPPTDLPYFYPFENHPSSREVIEELFHQFTFEKLAYMQGDFGGYLGKTPSEQSEPAYLMAYNARMKERDDERRELDDMIENFTLTIL